MAWTSPSTWVAGAVLTAAQLNQQVRDNLKAIGDPWTTYIATWTGSGSNPAIGNGSIDGAYLQAGKLVNFRLRIVTGSTTTYGSGNYSVSLPFTPSTGRWVFSGALRDASVGLTWPIFGEVTGGTVVLRTLHTTAGNQFLSMTPTVPVTLASGDEIFLSGTYEAA